MFGTVRIVKAVRDPRLGLLSPQCIIHCFGCRAWTLDQHLLAGEARFLDQHHQRLGRRGLRQMIEIDPWHAEGQPSLAEST